MVSGTAAASCEILGGYGSGDVVDLTDGVVQGAKKGLAKPGGTNFQAITAGPDVGYTP